MAIRISALFLTACVCFVACGADEFSSEPSDGGLGGQSQDGGAGKGGGSGAGGSATGGASGHGGASVGGNAGAGGSPSGGTAGTGGAAGSAGTAPCGNGQLEAWLDEQCDDGNNNPGDGCDKDCVFEPVGETCGSGGKDQGEACDDSNTLNGDACNPTCNFTNLTSLFVGSPGQGGVADGTGTQARISGSGVLAVDNDSLWLGDQAAHTVRRIDIATATVTTIAGQAAVTGYSDAADGSQALFAAVEGIATDDTRIWVTDSRRIRTIDKAAPHAVKTVAGSGTQGHKDGFGLAADFNDPRGMVWYGKKLYLVDGGSSVLFEFDPATTEVKTVAGTAGTPGPLDGIGTAAQLGSPRYVAASHQGILYISDTNGAKIRTYDVATGQVGTLAGNGTAGYVDGVGTAALVDRPRGICFDGTSAYWIEFGAQTIRQCVIASQQVSTMIGTVCGTPSTCPGGYAEGVGSAAQIHGAWSMVYHHASRSLFVADGLNFVIRRIQ
jgi:cysteine-rich repeat protein